MAEAELQLDDLPEPYRTIAEICGVEDTIQLAKIFSGEQVYFPKYDTVYRPLRDKKIIEEFDGYNFKRLAKKYGLTENAIRKICADNINTQRNKPLEGQTTIFDEL
jgi:Mor family transcriptional regulator|nr:MAG TPA: Mor transcription activator family [Caudoviricetes sp.]